MKSSNVKVILDESTIKCGVVRLARELAQSLDKRPLVLICILNGATYFTVDLSRALEDLGVRHSMLFVSASSYGHGKIQRKKVDLCTSGALLKSAAFTGRKAVVVDELYDSGKTLAVVKDAVATVSDGPPTTVTLMLKKRQSVERQFPLPDHWALEVPDVWLIGYGLDNTGEQRGLRQVVSPSE